MGGGMECPDGFQSWHQVSTAGAKSVLREARNPFVFRVHPSRFELETF